MTDYRDMLDSYQESIDLLKGRINELSEQIGSKKSGKDTEALGKLVDRRYKLYQEVWELQACMRLICEYIEAVEEREGCKRFEDVGA